jgi:hypothetical protein
MSANQAIHDMREVLHQRFEADLVELEEALRTAPPAFRPRLRSDLDKARVRAETSRRRLGL